MFEHAILNLQYKACEITGRHDYSHNLFKKIKYSKCSQGKLSICVRNRLQSDHRHKAHKDPDTFKNRRQKKHYVSFDCEMALALICLMTNCVTLKFVLVVWDEGIFFYQLRTSEVFIKRVKESKQRPECFFCTKMKMRF